MAYTVIAKKWLSDLSHEAIGIYILMVSEESRTGKIRFTQAMLLEDIKISESNVAARGKIKEALKELIDKGYILLDREIPKLISGHMIARRAKEAKKPFIMIHSNEIEELKGSNHFYLDVSLLLRLKDMANNKTRESFASLETLGAFLSVDRRVVGRSIKRIEKSGLIRVKKTHKEGGKKVNNIYTVLDTKENLSKKEDATVDIKDAVMDIEAKKELDKILDTLYGEGSFIGIEDATREEVFSSLEEVINEYGYKEGVLSEALLEFANCSEILSKESFVCIVKKFHQ